MLINLFLPLPSTRGTMKRLLIVDGQEFNLPKNQKDIALEVKSTNVQVTVYDVNSDGYKTLYQEGLLASFHYHSTEPKPITAPRIEHSVNIAESVSNSVVLDASIKEDSIPEPPIKEDSIKENSIKEDSVPEPTVKEDSVPEPIVQESSIQGTGIARYETIKKVKDGQG